MKTAINLSHFLNMSGSSGFYYHHLFENATQSRSIRAVDSVGGYSSGYGEYCPEGIPIEQALFGLLAAFAASFGFLFRAVTMITAPPMSRSVLRHESILFNSNFLEDLQVRAADLMWWGR